MAVLRRALLAERQRDYDDGIVVGGLDRLLARLLSGTGIPPGSPLARGMRDLAATGYASLRPVGRAQWVRSLLTLLDEPPRTGAGGRASGAGNPSRATPVPRPASSEARTSLSTVAARESTSRDPRHRATTGSRPDTRPRRKPAKGKPTTGDLSSSVDVLPGVNRGVAAKMRALGIESVEDLLQHFPHRYDDFSRIRPIAELVPGEQQTLVASVWTSASKQMGRFRSGTELIVGDTTGNLRIVYFNQPYLATKFRTGARVVLSGKVSVFQNQRQMESPEWELLDAEDDLAQAVHTGRMVPVYPLTAGVTGRTMRRAAHAAIDAYVESLPETLPDELIKRAGLLPRVEAVRQMHYPESAAHAEAARRRLAFDELLVLQLAVLRGRRERSLDGNARPLQLPQAMHEGFLSSLPFDLTTAQRRVSEAVLADIGRTTPMARLLQGDVGSGKTVVAALALLAAVASGYQGVLMAPTEILAEQHYRTLCRVFGAGEAELGPIYECTLPYHAQPLRIALLHGGLPVRVKTEVQAALATGEVEIVAGTQALIREQVQIQRLGLAVVDEQHRFGVMQRAALRDKGSNAHLLVMTATPIPRTLALTLYGDLDVSVIDEMPPGRKPVRTRLVQPEERENAYRFLRKQLAAGRQAFIICPLVEESEKVEVRAAVEEYERLRSMPIFADVSIGLLHGRMKTAEKDAIMQAFYRRESDILVSTAVVEVGIDVPNASIILIEGADRFGLAQLHQFRGRVGRGADQSYCLLLADTPSTEAMERLRLMESTQDGFVLAEADLRLRGPGEYFGTRQSGMPDLKVARLSDTPILEQARDEAATLLEQDPALGAEDLALLRARVERLDRGGEVN
ncbi:MAG TPA: ATP-dependent DNA helicase RecG [Steroidobacteraceae bacterium]|nr:ATP-dependent DNA helicase RecG [Steroidobacteraceae bacterium]